MELCGEISYYYRTKNAYIEELDRDNSIGNDEQLRMCTARNSEIDISWKYIDLS